MPCRVFMWPMISWNFYLTLLLINDRSSQVGSDNQSCCLLYVLLCSTDRRYWWCLLLFCVFFKLPQGTSIFSMLQRLSDVSCWFCTVINCLESSALRHVPPDFKSSLNWGNLTYRYDGNAWLSLLSFLVSLIQVNSLGEEILCPWCPVNAQVVCHSLPI